MKFTELGISEELSDILAEDRITDATLIQELSIPRILNGEDVVGKAQTGTGKTLAFLLPIFEKIDTDKNYTQGLIITPTRELALQISEEAKKLEKYKEMNILAAYGGQDVEKQVRKLKNGVHLIIGTPGRLLDHMNRKTLDLSNLDYLVVDEADEIINMGFLDDIEFIIKKTPKTRQTLLFSATMPKTIKSISRTSMKSPQRIEAVEKDITVDQINEITIETTDRGKEDALCKYIDENNPFMGIIFCRTKERVRKLTTKLKQRGYNVDEIHGDLSQAKRERAMKDFRDLKTQFLVATDVAARGLDIDGVTHVFNYDAPEKEAGYIHRIGRTGRAGGSGTAVTFVVQKEMDDRKRAQNRRSRDDNRGKSNFNKNRKPSRSGNRKFKNKRK